MLYLCLFENTDFNDRRKAEKWGPGKRKVPMTAQIQRAVLGCGAGVGGESVKGEPLSSSLHPLAAEWNLTDCREFFSLLL